MTRYDWYVRKATEMVELLPEATQKLLKEFNPLPNEPKVPQATLIALICSRYMDTYSSDWIAEHLAGSFFFDRSIEQTTILEEVVLPVCELYRRNDLPFDNYWDASEIYLELLDFYIHCRMRSPGEITELRAELSSHWLLMADDLKDEIIATARLDPSDIDLSLIKDPPDGVVGDAIRKVLSSSRIQEFIEQNLALYHPRMFKRPDLLRIARFMVTTDTIRHLSFDQSVSDVLLPRIEQARRKVGEAVMALSGAEMSLLVPADAERVLMERCVAQKRKLLSITEIGADALPDKINGRQSIPSRLHEYVFQIDGRLLRQSVGPIPHFFAALDSWVGNLPDNCGLGGLEISGSVIKLPILLMDRPDDPLEMPFRFNMEYVEAIFDMLLLVVVGSIRLDIVNIEGPGKLKMLGTSILKIPETILDEMKETVMTILRDRFGEDPETFGKALFQELTSN